MITVNVNIGGKNESETPWSKAALFCAVHNSVQEWSEANAEIVALTINMSDTKHVGE
jgi:hypothetical protein